MKDPETVQVLEAEGGTYALAERAINEGRSLRVLFEALPRHKEISYQGLIDGGRFVVTDLTPRPGALFRDGDRTHTFR